MRVPQKRPERIEIITGLGPDPKPSSFLDSTLRPVHQVYPPWQQLSSHKQSLRLRSSKCVKCTQRCTQLYWEFPVRALGTSHRIARMQGDPAGFALILVGVVAGSLSWAAVGCKTSAVRYPSESWRLNITLAPTNCPEVGIFVSRVMSYESLPVVLGSLLVSSLKWSLALFGSCCPREVRNVKKAFNCLSSGSSNLLKLWSKLVPTGYGAKWAKCFRSWLWALASLLGSSLCRQPRTLQAAPRPFASPKDVASSTSTIVLKRQLREFMSCSRVLLGLICLSVFSDVSSGGFFLGRLGRHRWKAGDYGKDDAGRGRCNLVQCLQGFKVHLVNTRCIWDVYKFQRPASRVVHVEALLGSALQRDCSHYVWVHTRFS